MPVVTCGLLFLCWWQVENVGVVIDMLRRVGHNGFPVLHTSAALAANPRLGSLAGASM